LRGVSSNSLSSDPLYLKINQLCCLKIRDGISIKEILAYGQVSFWWSFERFLYFGIKRGTYKPAITDFLKPLLGKYHFLSRLLISVIVGKLVRFKEINDSRKKIVMISQNGGVWLPPLNPTSKKMKEFKFFEPIIHLCRKKYRIVVLGESSSLSTIVGSFLEKMKYEPGLWKPLGPFLTFNTILKVFKYSRKLENEWHHLQRNSALMKYIDINSLFLRLEFFFRYVAFESILHLELMNQAIETEKPDLIIISGEYFGLGRAAVIAGKLKGVPTLALQHGIIHPYHHGYVHPKNEISNKISLKHCIIPDKTAVYGNYTKEILTKICNYPNESVVVTGQLTYDVLIKAKEAFREQKFLKQHGLDPTKKTILLITQDYSPSHEFLKVTVKALKKFPEVQTIIKPHPGDTEPKWHKEILTKENYHALVLDPKSNTFEALFACDVMITVSSTVAIEAMFLNKPVVIVNLTGEPDPMPYVESGAALGAYEEKDVAHVIRKALFDEDTRRELEKNRKEFVKYHLHNVGNATKNVVRLIEKMIAD